MAWLPVSNTVIQYVDTNGNPYSGAVLKLYAAGTSTNIPVATSQTGTPTVTSVALNSSGFPAVSGNVVVLFIDQDFKVALYPTQAAADSNTGALWTIDNIDPFAVLTLPTNLTDINALTPSDGTIIVGDGSKWVAESGNTARTSLGLGTGNSPQFTALTISGLTTGHVVLANSAGALTALDVTAKGSIIAGDGTGAPITLAAGTNGQVVSYDSTAASGLIPLTLPAQARDYQQFTSSGTYTKPTGAKFVLVEIWSGGGGGSNNTQSSTTGGGGSGGEYVFCLFDASVVGATETVTIGAGGAGGPNASTANGSTGGNTTFGSLLTAIGGNPGVGTADAFATIPRARVATALNTELKFEAIPFSQAGYGGKVGTGNGGNTQYGGGGGGSSGGGLAGGVSAKGGNGGAGNNTLNTVATAGSAPAGGGGGSGNDGGGGAGARGECRVWTW